MSSQWKSQFVDQFGDNESYDRLKEFIETLLQSQREDLKMEILNLKRGTDLCGDEFACSHKEANKVLDEALAVFDRP